MIENNFWFRKGVVHKTRDVHGVVAWAQGLDTQSTEYKEHVMLRTIQWITDRKLSKVTKMLLCCWSRHNPPWRSVYNHCTTLRSFIFQRGNFAGVLARHFHTRILNKEGTVTGIRVHLRYFIVKIYLVSHWTWNWQLYVTRKANFANFTSGLSKRH